MFNLKIKLGMKEQNSINHCFFPISHKQVVDFLLSRHYSGGKPGIAFSLGTFIGPIVIGTIS